MPSNRWNMETGNSDELTFERRPHYLYTRIQTDHADREKVMENLRQIIDKAAESRLRRIMIDRVVPVAPSNWHDILVLLTFHRVAIVNHFPDITAELQTTLEIPIHPQIEIKVFEDPTDAETWLLAAEPPEVVVFS